MKTQLLVSALSVGMALAVSAATSRNLAHRCAVYQSSAVDYTQVGHLATDGQRVNAAFRPVAATCEFAPSCPAGEVPAMAIDGSDQTKWLVFSDHAWLGVLIRGWNVPAVSGN